MSYGGNTSQNVSGRSADGIVDGKDEVFDLSMSVFVMLNSCLDEVNARILVLKINKCRFGLLYDFVDEFKS